MILIGLTACLLVMDPPGGSTVPLGQGGINVGGTPDVGEPVQVVVNRDGVCILGETGLVHCVKAGIGYGGAPELDGEFVLLSAGGYGLCGVHDDGSVACSGDDLEDVRSGSFETVRAQEGTACALDAGGGVSCWGDNNFGQGESPSGTYLDVAPSGLFTAAVRSDGTIAFWGNEPAFTDDIEGREFVEVVASSMDGCARQGSGSVRCFGLYESISASGWDTLRAGYGHFCGLDGDRVECIGDNGDYQSDAPGAAFVDVDAGGDVTCGLRTDARVQCWGDVSDEFPFE